MVAHNPHQSSASQQQQQQQLKQRPVASSIRLEPADDHFEFALSRCGSISGQSIGSTQSWSDSPAARQRRIKFLAARSAAQQVVAKFDQNSNHYSNSSSIGPGKCSGRFSPSFCMQPPPPQPQPPLLLDCSWDSVSQQFEPGARRRRNTRFHSYRFVVTMLGGTSVGLMLLLRFNITIAILQMVNQTHLYLEEHPNATLDDYLAEGYSAPGGDNIDDAGGEFNWNNEIVAIILAWYMFGYTLPGPLMAKLASSLGCRRAVPLLLSTCAVSTLLTPGACRLGWQYVVACRLLNGLGASAVIPQLLSLIEKWVRYDEITAGLSLAYLLNATLAAITPLLCGYLTELHWSYAFYVPALFTFAFCVLWLALITDEPHTNWLISERELDHLAQCEKLDTNRDLCDNRDLCHNQTKVRSGESKRQQQQQVVIAVAQQQKQLEHQQVVDKLTVTQKEEEEEQQQQQQQEELTHTPDSWLAIFSVPSFYAYIALWCCYCSSYSGFVFVLPAYMQQFLKIHVSENGFYCFIIQLGCIVSVLWPHQMLKFCQRTLGLSGPHSRIACYALCCSVGAFTWIYVGTQHASQLGMLFLNRAAHPGNDVLVTSCLMANYAKAGLSGHAFAVVNTLGNFSIVISSTFIGWLLDYTGASPAGWCCIFVGLGATQLVMFVIFATCVGAEPIEFKRKRAVAVPAAVTGTGKGKEKQVIDCC